MWLDKFFARTFQALSVDQAPRQSVNFGTGLTVVDDGESLTVTAVSIAGHEVDQTQPVGGIKSGATLVFNSSSGKWVIFNPPT